MNKKQINVGKELVKRTKNLNNTIESIMGKSAKTESLLVSDGLVMDLYAAGDSCGNYVRVDFTDYGTYKDYCIIMNRSKLKEMADFILNYLENK